MGQGYSFLDWPKIRGELGCGVLKAEPEEPLRHKKKVWAMFTREMRINIVLQQTLCCTRMSHSCASLSTGNTAVEKNVEKGRKRRGGK